MPAQPRPITIDGIPILVAEPSSPAGGIAFWLPWFTGTKEIMEPGLIELAGRGWLAISIDPFQHGSRAIDADNDAMAARVFGAFRSGMWPIFGQTTQDVLTTIAWAQDRVGAESLPMVAGGISMGGDIAIAVAGAHQGVVRAAGIGSTPDWTRPGMRSMGGTQQVIDQGSASDEGAGWYARFNPLTHADRYRRPLAMRFEGGAEDDHVPIEAAGRFATALEGQVGPTVAVNVHPGMDHGAICSNPDVTAQVLGWLADG